MTDRPQFMAEPLPSASPELLPSVRMLSSPVSPATGEITRTTAVTEKKGRGSGSGRTRPVAVWWRRIIRMAVDMLLAPYRWLFPPELFAPIIAPSRHRRRNSLDKQVATAAGRSIPMEQPHSFAPDQQEIVEHSPSWSPSDLYRTAAGTGPQPRLPFRVSQLLAAAHEPSQGPYCLRNGLITISDLSRFTPSFFAPNAYAEAKQKTLVIDLDETLVYTTSDSSSTADLITEVPPAPDRPRAMPSLYYVHKRPHVDRFLALVADWYRVAVYTASRAEYARIVCDWLDPKGRIFAAGMRFFRDSCIAREGIFLKDLTLIEPDMSRVCLLDNSPCSFLLCPDNAIPIPGWTGTPNDRGLLELLPLLDALRFTVDVRSVLSLRRVM